MPWAVGVVVLGLRQRLWGGTVGGQTGCGLWKVQRRPLCGRRLFVKAAMQADSQYKKERDFETAGRSTYLLRFCGGNFSSVALRGGGARTALKREKGGGLAASTE